MCFVMLKRLIFENAAALGEQHHADISELSQLNLLGQAIVQTHCEGPLGRWSYPSQSVRASGALYGPCNVALPSLPMITLAYPNAPSESRNSTCPRDRGSFQATLQLSGRLADPGPGSSNASHTEQLSTTRGGNASAVKVRDPNLHGGRIPRLLV